ncbi:PadR family transcriptional regulator, partial [Bacillus cereus]
GYFQTYLKESTEGPPRKYYQLTEQGETQLNLLVTEWRDFAKGGVRWEKGMIVFNSIAPDEKLFDVENFKRAFLTRMSIEGDVVL